MSDENQSLTRRQALGAAASTSAVLLAGCNVFSTATDSDSTASESPSERGGTPTPRQAVQTGSPTEHDESADDSESGSTTATSTPTDVPTPTPTETPTPTPTPTETPPPTPTEACLEFDRETLDTAETVGRDVRRAVVYLTDKTEAHQVSKISGTGWFLDDTHVITNGHVVDGLKDDETLYAWTINQNGYATRVVDFVYEYSTATNDVALLELTEGSAPHSLSTGSTDDLSDGQPVIQIGQPGILGRWLIALGTYVKRPDVSDLVTDIPHTGGDSGAPVLTLDGTVVGLHWGSSPKWSNWGEPPKPFSDEIYTELPKQQRIESKNVQIERVMKFVERWREE